MGNQLITQTRRQFVPTEETSECQSWFFPEELKLRQKCVARVVDINYLTAGFYIIIGCILAVVLVLILAALVVYEIRRREKLQGNFFHSERVITK